MNNNYTHVKQAANVFIEETERNNNINNEPLVEPTFADVHRILASFESLKQSSDSEGQYYNENINNNNKNINEDNNINNEPLVEPTFADVHRILAFI